MERAEKYYVMVEQCAWMDVCVVWCAGTLSDTETSLAFSTRTSRQTQKGKPRDRNDVADQRRRHRVATVTTEMNKMEHEMREEKRNWNKTISEKWWMPYRRSVFVVRRIDGACDWHK